MIDQSNDYSQREADYEDGYRAGCRKLELIAEELAQSLTLEQLQKVSPAVAEWIAEYFNLERKDNTDERQIRSSGS